MLTVFALIACVRLFVVKYPPSLHSWFTVTSSTCQLASSRTGIGLQKSAAQDAFTLMYWDEQWFIFTFSYKWNTIIDLCITPGTAPTTSIFLLKFSKHIQCSLSYFVQELLIIQKKRTCICSACYIGKQCCSWTVISCWSPLKLMCLLCANSHWSVRCLRLRTLTSSG